MLLLAAACGFMIEGRAVQVDEQGFRIDTLLDAYLYTLEGFFSGIAVRNINDIAFGIAAVIILLNVVIAIVSNAWEDAVSNAGPVFWEFRLTFLSHQQRIFTCCHCTRVFPPWLTSLLERLNLWIDDRRDLRIKDEVDWVDPPFCNIDCLEHYLYPEQLLEHEDAMKVRRMQSFEGEVFWSLREGKEKHWSAQWLIQLKVAAKWCANAVVYALLVLLGLVTFGILWPVGFRRAIFGNNYSEPPSSTNQPQAGIEVASAKEDRLLELQNRCESIAKRMESIDTSVSRLVEEQESRQATKWGRDPIFRSS